MKPVKIKFNIIVIVMKKKVIFSSLKVISEGIKD